MTFDWEEDNGNATGSPAKGTSRTASRTEQNWKSVDDSATAYNSASINAGNNSYEKWISGKFSGTFSSVSSVLWAHTAGSMGTGLTIKGTVGTTYTTPSTTTNTNLTTDMTSPIGIGSGQAVLVGGTGPEAAGKAASTTTNPAWTQFLTTQLQTTTSAANGDTATSTFSLQVNVN